MSHDTIHLRRLKLTLPASMKATAQHDARRIAEAVAQRLHETGGQPASVTLEGRRQSAVQLASRVAAAWPKGGRHGG